MKRFITRTTRLFLVLLFPLSLTAQVNPDYRILLHAGEFVPEKNISTVSSASPVLQQSLFAEKYYITIQFLSLPDNAMKAQLKSAGVELIDYIPNNAYTAAVSANVNPDVFRSFPVRAIFQFTPTQKTNRELLDKQVPAHASAAAGYADVTITTYEKMPAAVISASLQPIGAIVLEDIQIFRNFVTASLRIFTDPS
ncbi:MAG: hypothetical protein AAB221_03070, partial [Bacteroidota bacterium]